MNDRAVVVGGQEGFRAAGRLDQEAAASRPECVAFTGCSPPVSGEGAAESGLLITRPLSAAHEVGDRSVRLSIIERVSTPGTRPPNAGAHDLLPGNHLTVESVTLQHLEGLLRP